MTGRIQHLLLVALFAATHLIAQPLAATGRCMGAMEMGGQCCCSLSAADPGASLGCCGSESPSDDEPSDSEGYDSECTCHVSPPTPALPEHGLSSAAEGDECSKTTEAAWDALQSNVWPSAVVRAARPPNQPPWVASRSTPAFTQVYRL